MGSKLARIEKKFGIYTAIHDSENVDSAQAALVPSNCWIEIEEDVDNFESSLDMALESQELSSKNGGVIDIPKATLMEIKAWADNLSRQ